MVAGEHTLRAESKVTDPPQRKTHTQRRFFSERSALLAARTIENHFSYLVLNMALAA